MRPGRAAVILPLSNATWPLTITCADAFGVLVRPLERREVADRRRIEDRDVGLHPFAQDAAIGEADPLRGKRRHLADRVLERDHLQLPHVAAEHARERAVAARMRARLAEDRHLPVGPDHRRRMAEDALQILLVDRVVDARAAALLDDPQRRLGGVLDRRLQAAPLRDLAKTLAGERRIPVAARQLHVVRIAAAALLEDDAARSPSGSPTRMPGVRRRFSTRVAAPLERPAGISAAWMLVDDAVYGY